MSNTTATIELVAARSEDVLDALTTLEVKTAEGPTTLSVAQARAFVAVFNLGRIKEVQRSAANKVEDFGLILKTAADKPLMYGMTPAGTRLINRAYRQVLKDDAAPQPQAQAPKPAAKPAASMTHFSHAACDHESTPAARAACRKAHKQA